MRKRRACALWTPAEAGALAEKGTWAWTWTPSRWRRPEHETEGQWFVHHEANRWQNETGEQEKRRPGTRTGARKRRLKHELIERGEDCSRHAILINGAGNRVHGEIRRQNWARAQESKLQNTKPRNPVATEKSRLQKLASWHPDQKQSWAKTGAEKNHGL
jgi:hypothetical protein